MTKKILVTGATDGIGLETAKKLVAQGHQVLLHGRNQAKLATAETMLANLRQEAGADAVIESFVADLSVMSDVVQLANDIAQKHSTIDVVINNAGVFTTPQRETADGLDVRFAVNTIAPYLLTKHLMPLLGAESRVVNLSSAAQSPVDVSALAGNGQLSDGAAYAQSKLALTMWSRVMGLALKETGPMIVSINPASMLGSKMVKDAYGVAGGDLTIGADILCLAALSDDFAGAFGLYFDNDIGQFSQPHPDALNEAKAQQVVDTIDAVLASI